MLRICVALVLIAGAAGCGEREPASHRVERAPIGVSDPGDGPHPASRPPRAIATH